MRIVSVEQSVSEPRIDEISARAYTLPTDRPESDGTLEWNSTTMVTAHVRAGGVEGFGYTYSHASAAGLIEGVLAQALQGRRLAPVACWRAMVVAVRNLGYSGIAATAISAVDVALWDAAARAVAISLATMLGREASPVPVYGSGGFTSYTERELCGQLAGWVTAGIPRVKMKIGREPDRDSKRVRDARAAISEEAELFVDANGAYSVKQAVALSHRFVDESNVVWLEEPCPATDIPGNRFVREHAPPTLEIAGGEYIFSPQDAAAQIDGRAVDVLQADVTRCGGITGLSLVAALAEQHHAPLSAHCAPALSAHAFTGLPGLRHLEYFHDHVRIERMLFDGLPALDRGALRIDLTRPGHGLELKDTDADPYRVA